jgi:hypothetical protein
VDWSAIAQWGYPREKAAGTHEEAGRSSPFIQHLPVQLFHRFRRLAEHDALLGHVEVV